MIITCEACGTSYKVKASLINPTGSTVKCSKCEHVFVAYPPSAESQKPAEYGRETETPSADFKHPATETFFEDAAETEKELDSIFGDDDEEEGAETGLTREMPTTDETEMSLGELDEEMKAETEDFQADQKEIHDLTPEEEASLFADFEDEPETEFEELTPDLEIGAVAEDDSDILTFEELEADEEVISLSDLEESGDVISFEDLAPGATNVEEIDLDELTATSDFEIGEETEEADLDMADVEAEAEYQPEASEEADLLDLDKGVQPTEVPAAGREEEPEAKGGLVSELEEDFGKKREDEKLPKQPETSEEQEDLTDSESAETVPEETQEEFDLDLDLDAEDEDVAETAEISTEEDEFDLDLEDLDLDLTEEAEAPVAEETEVETTEAGDSDLGLDFDELDLDLEEETTEAAGEADELDLDFEGPKAEEAPEGETEDFDLDLDLEEESEAAAGEEGDFELDLDFEEPEAAGPEAGEEDAFELDLEEAPEATGEAEEEFDLDLDLEEASEDAAHVTAEAEDFELDLDFEEPEEEAASGATDEGVEEFDLTEVEDFLEETPEAGETELEDAFDLDLETAAETAPAEPEEDEFDLDLETMLDEESEVAGEAEEAEKEVALEAFGDQREEATEAVEAETEESTEELSTAAAAAATTAEVVRPEPVAETRAPAEKTATAPAPAARPRKGRPVLVGLIVAIVLGLVAVGAYMFYTAQQAPEVPDSGNLRIAVSTPSYEFIENETAGELLAVTGTVTNRYDQARQYIQVQANLYNDQGNLIRKSTAFAGNMFEAQELQTFDMSRINEALANRGGDGNQNIGVKPGDTIPFTVVFANLPDNLDELSVEVLSSASSE